MAPKKPQVLPAASVVEPKEKGELVQLIPTLTTEVQELSIKTAEDYAYADGLLSRVRAARGIWKPIWARIQEKSIKPIRDGLEGLYEMNREVDGPLEKLEEAIKRPMKAFKIHEAFEIARKRQLQEAEVARLAREAEEKQRAAEQAKTPQMRGRLVAQAAKAQEQSEVIAAIEAPAPLQVEGSGTRTKKKPEVSDRAVFLKAMADGFIPEDCIIINQAKLNAYYKDDPEGMQVWPGISIVDDIQIVGR